MENKKPLYREVGEDLLGGELARGGSWKSFMVEGLSTCLIPGYTINRAERNVDYPKEARLGLSLNITNEVVKASIWSRLIYEAFSNYIS
jgi:hypothetical protein